MSAHSRQVSNNLLVLGVTKVTDSYPHVKYRLKMMEELWGENYREIIVDLAGSTGFGADSKRSLTGKLIKLWQMVGGHVKVLWRYWRQPASRVYIPYPGIFLAWLLSWLPAHRRPHVVLDAFISIYDTVVYDRQLIGAETIRAKLLYGIELRAFEMCEKLLVDTEENARYYADLFRLDPQKITPLPLNIPPLGICRRSSGDGKLRVLFVGTFVPLQGTQVIADAAWILRSNPRIEFVIIGDGQDASYLDHILEENELPNLTWHRGQFSTDFIQAETAKAQVCLGIFSGNEKSDRVLPYKIYYYLAMGMPVVTAQTNLVKKICSKTDPSPIQMIPAGNAKALADCLVQQLADPDQLVERARAAIDVYEAQLSSTVIKKQLYELFSEDA